MDIFKGIGDFFGGLFGQKKKREDEQQQPQQQQSAVSFNSTPKLGDNFANNASNPTQPQQPKEFAKSSVDLNPVKPVQPVQPQPQVNRDQERQQLADKYRQEETDRYNQGSDHAANFLNDIFSGGKTAQMRENTINQNIQNRVNAEMLRKYGPDDQQVKQNIAQTSQDINNNATSVNNFTKNYNNTVQQTVASPVSAVKGAANSVVETMPKVSGAVTELGANTIKLFDEDNQFANNLINRVRADREKNIVRKTLNSATGLTDQDNKMAYGLGSSGTRMAIDAAMTPITGGVAPAVVHGVEAHSEMMDSLDNIEARKKAEAAAKGEAYTPSSFGSRYLASTANAGAQAAIEKLGIDNVTGKIGGKFAKNMVGRAVTGALGEAGEEAAQQYAENFTKKLFDNKQNIHEGVAESALMGGIMGGAGKMAFGGMDSVKNPYKSNDMADGEVSISKLHPDQMGYNPKNLINAERNTVRTGLFNKNNANSDLSLADKEFNIGAPERLAKALRNGADGDVSFMRMPNRLLGEVNTIRQNIGQNPLKTNEITAYKNAVNNHLNKRVLEGMSPETAAHIAADSFINPYSKALPVDNNGAYDRNHIQMAAGGNHAGKYNTTTFSQFGDNISLKNITPRKSAEIKNLLQRREEILSGSSDGGAGVVPSSTDVGGAPFSAGRATYTNNIAQNPQNVNNTKTIYNSNIRKAPDLVSYDANGNDTELKSNAYDSNIAQKVNDFNREYEPEIQDLQNVYRKYGDDFEFNLTPEQQAVYEHLLRESPRDSEGRYIDPATGEMTIDQIVQDSKGDLVEIDQNIFEGVPRNERAKTLRKYLQQNLQGNEYGLNYDRDGNVRITKDSTHKIANPRQNAFTLGKKGEMISELPDILTISQKTGWAPDGKDHSFARDGFEYRQSRVKLGDEVYTVNLNVGLSQNGKVLYEINGIKKESPITGANSSFESSDPFNTNSIAQNSQNVNTADPENRYLLNSAPETDQKTRKFAETVLDTDTPPKDFVKLMHAGDESLKYTPKKNSEMWSRATKSVQESPERVFNELENTRVANDETMAKGIALAKHYQAMGDDLKASELYVELAKKATEAGRTVQALNLMRRTTPEGVLMSTMREVENYNDKMKNKPNKQINITPEQRAEFLGRLREAYAMPEGN